MAEKASRRIKSEDLERFEKFVGDGVIGAPSKIEPKPEWVEIHFDDQKALHSFDLLRRMIPVLEDPKITTE